MQINVFLLCLKILMVLITLLRLSIKIQLDPSQTLCHCLKTLLPFAVHALVRPSVHPFYIFVHNYVMKSPAFKNVAICFIYSPLTT